jgi:hypothetical protein
MSDLPERIWAFRDSNDRGRWVDDNKGHLGTFQGVTEYRRADLSAPVGFSREQMRDIFCEGAITRGDMAKCDQYLATLTPANDGRGVV